MFSEADSLLTEMTELMVTTGLAKGPRSMKT